MTQATADPSRPTANTNGSGREPRTQLIAHALAYADRGWHVFPLLAGSKRPATPGHRAADCDRSDPWCRAGHTGWQDRATRNLDRITRAWSSHPHGIGIACGPSRLLVIDTDRHKPGDPVPPSWHGRGITSGEDVLTTLADEHHRQLPPTWTVTTPTGGVHRYYQSPDGLGLGNSAGLLGWLIDTRGIGGYVAAPPNTLPGGEYTIRDDRTPAPLPDWLTHLLTRDVAPSSRGHFPPATPVDRSTAKHADRAALAYVNAAVNGETAKVRNAVTGTRNHALFCAAVALGQLVAGHALVAGTARYALLDACAVHIASGGFTHHEADATITSGLSRGANNPRTPTGRTAA